MGEPSRGKIVLIKLHCASLICKIFKNTFFTEYLRTTASVSATASQFNGHNQYFHDGMEDSFLLTIILPFPKRRHFFHHSCIQLHEFLDNCFCGIVFYHQFDGELFNCNSSTEIFSSTWSMFWFCSLKKISSC